MNLVSNLNSNTWSEFVAKHTEGNIFQTPEMYNVYKSTKNYEPHFIAVIENDQVLALQLTVIQRVFSSVLGELTTRAIIFGGPLVLNDDKKALDLLLNGYNDQIKKKAIYSDFRNQWDWENLIDIFSKYGFNYNEHLDILFDLTKGEELLWNEVNPKRRRGINKVIKSDVDFSIKEIDLSNKDLLNECYLILLEVYKRIKIPLHGIEFFKNAKKIHGDNLLAMGLFIGDEIIAVRFALCYGTKIYDWYAGAKDEYLKLRPNDILPWEMIKWGVKNDYKIYDFGGAGKPNIPYGVRDFKLTFGGRLVEFGRFKKIHKPIMMSLAKFGLAVYKLIK